MKLMCNRKSGCKTINDIGSKDVLEEVVRVIFRSASCFWLKHWIE